MGQVKNCDFSVDSVANRSFLEYPKELMVITKLMILLSSKCQKLTKSAFSKIRKLPKYSICKIKKEVEFAIKTFR